MSEGGEGGRTQARARARADSLALPTQQTASALTHGQPQTRSRDSSAPARGKTLAPPLPLSRVGDDKLVDRLSMALDKGRLDLMATVLDEIERRGLRFDTPPLSEQAQAVRLASDVAAEVLDVNHDYIDDATAELVIRLLQLGCDPNATDDKDTPLLSRACKSNHEGLVRFLLEECPTVYRAKLDRQARNAAMIAHDYGNVGLYDLLEQAGVPLQPVNEAMKFYRAYRSTADADMRDKLLNYLHELLDCDYFADLPDEDGKTLLFHAIDDGEIDVIAVLDALGAPPNVRVRDGDGRTVFDHAAQIADDRLRDYVLQRLHHIRHQSSVTTSMKRRSSADSGQH